MASRVSSRRLDRWAEPASVFARAASLPGSALLESQSRVHGAHFSIICVLPFGTLCTKDGTTTLTLQGTRTHTTESPFDLIKKLLAERRIPPIEDVPFAGGLVGHFGYELRVFAEECEVRARNDLGIPDCRLGLYDAAAVFDHETRTICINSIDLPGGGSGGIAPRALESLIAEAVDGAPEAERPPIRGGGILSSNFTKDEYLRAVRRVKEYIAAGDVYQVNVAQRFIARAEIDPWALYTRLKERNPAPYAAYLDQGDFRIVSSSPELFLRLDPHSRMVETKPIKGTRPRSSDPDEDRRLAEELLASEKDRAENVMIVDLERNDIGRVCETGSVSVPELAAIESHPTVHHLVSTVTGRLRPDRDAVDLLTACFPGGSITGAPKIRAMEIIDEIEPVTRGVYTGSIGYLGFDGGMTLSIAIRTAVVRDDLCTFHMGGGIVADSDPEAEYEETLDKGRAFFEVLQCTMT